MPRMICVPKAEWIASEADLRPPFEPRHDHEPADRTLHSAEHEQGHKAPAIPLRDLAPHGKPADSDEEHEPQDSAEQPVHPFPEEDELEPPERHSGWPG